MPTAALIRFRSDEVVWYETESADQLAGLLRERQPPLRGAYAILHSGGRRPRRFVFTAPSFRARWTEAAASGFAAAEVERLFLSGDVATPVRRGARRPPGPAYDPDSGDVWAPTAKRSARRSRQRAPSAGEVRFEVELPESAAGSDRMEVDRAGEPLRRVPHLDLEASEDRRPGATLVADVYCDCSPARAGEEVEEIAVDLPAGWQRAELGVWLALGPQFEAATAVGAITVISGEEESSHARFELRVVDDPPPGPGWITAVFSYRGRPCGQVGRAEPLHGTADSEETPEPPPAVVDVLPGAERPDLTLEIKSAGGSEQEFSCRVRTTLVPDQDDPAPNPWRLSQRAPELVAGFMEGFVAEGLSDGARRTRLRGAGMKLWEAAPAELRDVFWKMIDEGTPPRTIFVVTDEWAFPWELLVPVRGMGADREEREALGVEFAVGRWVTGAMTSPPQHLSLLDSYAFAPEYPPERELECAPAEAEYVCENLNGTRIAPGNFTELEASFKDRAVALAHFACHGESSAGFVQTLLMEDLTDLRSDQVAAMKGLTGALGSRQPMVFLNACEAGRPQPSLVGVGGFATEFISVGASCVVAPSWSVDDEIAHALAIAFYDRLRAGPKSRPAAVLSDLRARAYGDGGADSWAAYSFYGDPLLQVEFEVRSNEEEQ